MKFILNTLQRGSIQKLRVDWSSGYDISFTIAVSRALKPILGLTKIELQQLVMTERAPGSTPGSTSALVIFLPIQIGRLPSVAPVN